MTMVKSQNERIKSLSANIMERPHRLGVVSRLYPELTATFLTEALRNVYYGDSKPTKFQSIDSTYFEWEVEVFQHF